MDDFVCSTLTEWGLSEWIDKFREQGIDKESLYCLDDYDIQDLIPIVGPRSKFKRRLQVLKEKQNTNGENDDSDDLAQVWPSTSNTEAKRKVSLQGGEQLPASKRQCDTIPGSHSETFILSDVKDIMARVCAKLQNNREPIKLNTFLKNKIRELETDKRELVGVFGKTGAGKSSLINAVLEEKNLLPSGKISACTSVMIKVEANVNNSKYEAEIEFITVEEWRNELWSSCLFLQNQEKDDDIDDDEYRDIDEKLSALYGEEWKQQIQSHENLMDIRYFREIPEFLLSQTKMLTAETAKALSTKIIKYTRSDSKRGEGTKGDIRRWYWPLVKCVTVKVPNKDRLQHVTLVDLPGSGDRNKSRDEMWKGIVGDCSAVWIVTEINRPAAEKEPWEILKGAASFIGNGGQCQYIHFICTKSDSIVEADNSSPTDILAHILEENKHAKEVVKAEFGKQNHIKKHFSDDTFKVFTVSSKEFHQPKHLKPEDTEIPQLQEFLQNLNDSHSVTLNYVSGARGILSLIRGTVCREVANKNTEVCVELENNLNHHLREVQKVMEETYKAFEKCLSVGVEKSKHQWERDLKSIYPRTYKKGFHMTLKCIVKNGGIYKPKKGAPININMKLSSHLTDSIDEEFRKTFPQKTEGQCGPFKGVINSFSLDTENLIEKYKDVELQLIFLKTEEDMMKTKLNQMIRDCKKIIYRSLMETIEKTMKTAYDRAATFAGQNVVENMRFTLQKHVYDSKDIMFEEAKNNMLEKLKDLQKHIMDTLKKTMMESIELSLKTDDHSIPDVSKEHEMVKKYYNALCKRPEGEQTLSG